MKTSSEFYFCSASGRRRRVYPCPVRQFLRRAAIFCAACAVLVGFMAAFVPLVLDAAEREQQWRADRLCRQGYYCNPNAGP